MSTREEDVVTQIFVASTHTPVLFFSSRGMVYRMKVWRLPAATPQSIGKALVNLLPLAEGETITSILPLPEDRDDLGRAGADVRHQHRQRAPQQPRRLREHQPQRQDRHEARRGRPHRARSQICSAATRRRAPHRPARQGRCIRFLLDDEVRLFKGRDSDGVRGIRLDDGRRGHLDGHPAPCRGRRRASARPTSSRRWPCAAPRVPRWRTAAPEPDGRGGGGRRARRADAGALRRARRARAVRADRVRARLRQALLVLRVPDLRAAAAKASPP